MNEKCGCKIISGHTPQILQVFGAKESEPKIEFCLLHAAAAKLLEVLEEIASSPTDITAKFSVSVASAALRAAKGEK